MSFGKSERAPSRICKGVCLKSKGLNESNLITINAIEVPEICFDSLSPPCKNDPKILQTVAKIYDPLGLLSPFTITAKILLQKIWLRKYDWDSVLSEDLCEIWVKWFNEYSVPRCIMRNSEDYVESHIFADASPQAYGAVAYLRVTENDGIIRCNILMAKNRVAPMNHNGDKELTLPKLELTAALCAARLQNFIITNFHIKVDGCVLWTDSKVALYWIKGKATRWKPYVCHRVTEIQKLSVGDWRHCPGTDNPADLSRGLKVNSFIESKVWLYCPDWLMKNKEEWPSEELVLPEDDGPVFVSFVQTDDKENNEEAIFPIQNFSDLEKVLRITAYVFRFTNMLKGVRAFPSNISTNEMIESEIYWIKITQKQNFRNEVTSLNNGKQIDSQSSLLTLNPFLDKHGIMRLGGRPQDSLLSYDAKHPVLLPKKSYFTDRLIWISHIATCHGGVNMTITQIRKKFWIIQARQRVKSVLKDCMSCKKLRAKSDNEPFAPLPRDRLNAVAPFKITGVDFAGPVFIKTNNGIEKVYIMLMTCAAIRAVHLELVPDLTADSCIWALRRFISRRGVPDVIYSDNAKTFKRTAKQLPELSKILCTDEIKNLANHQRIQWKFNVERASWWGGFWERLVKSMKDALKRKN